MIKGENKILITGGTGSLGRELVRQLSEHNDIVVYSRNEERQYYMKQEFIGKQVSFYIGDVRDQQTLEMALKDCNIAIHAAAMKDLIMCESQPTQTCLNNIEGSKSVIQAVRNTPSVKTCVAVSTDKAAAPCNVYGASKYIMEKLFEEANRHYDATFFSVRFGNMIDSAGSLIDVWKTNPDANIKLTHPEVSRFFFTLKEAAEAVIHPIDMAKGGEIFIRKMKKARIYDILKVITGRENFEIIGLFPGEKIHEDLVSANESRFCYDIGDYYVVRPDKPNPESPDMFNTSNAKAFTEGELRKMIFPEQ